MRVAVWWAVLILALTAPVAGSPRSADEVHECVWCHPFVAGTSSAGHSGSPDIGQRPSELCLGCHPVSIEVSESNGASRVVGRANHPVGVAYEPSGHAALRLPDSPSGAGGSIEADLLHDGMIECTSCHDVHHSRQRALLVVSNDGSRLCLTCHDR
jgi:predicted CXXCH cytochrome family protein